MSIRRSVVDYSLQRRALLADVYSGRTGTFEACDAHPYLQRAAKYHGSATETNCPICRKERLTNVYYIYGDQLGHMSGQAKAPVELPALAATHSEFNVYVVEVCKTCGWNHLVRSFVLGEEPDEQQDRPRGRRKAARE